MGKQIRISAPNAEGAILRLLDICNPGDIATAVDLFIERLDKLSGDPDLEQDGDEEDGSMAEDDFCHHSLAYPGPGCPVSDGSCSTGSGAGDPAWAEWHSRGRHKLGEFGEEQCRSMQYGGINMAHEDSELDDPIEANGDEHDGVNAEDEQLTQGAILRARRGGGCDLADGLEPSLGMPEIYGGRWPDGDRGSNSDDEPWFVPAHLNSQMVPDDQVPA